MAERRRIVVTGASSGIGRELALQLAAPGCALWLIGRHRERLDEMAVMARQAGAEATPVVLDLTDLDAAARFLASGIDGGAAPDEAYLAAAVSVFGEVKDLQREDWEAVYRTDLLSPAQWVHAIYAAMVGRGSGRIVLVSSLAALGGYPTSTPYAAMKAGLHGLCLSLWPEAEAHGVHLHIAFPGYVDTPIFRNAIYRGTTIEENLERIRKLGFKLMPPADAARAILTAVRRGRRAFAFPGYAAVLKWLAPRCPAAVRPIHRAVLRNFRNGNTPARRPPPPAAAAGAFAGRVAIVTGAGSGIGRALVDGLVAAGARVHAVDLDTGALDALAARHRGAALETHALDVTDWDAYGRMVGQVIDADHAVDFLFNNAGVTLLGEAHRVPFDRWRWLLDANVLGVACGIAHVYPHMIRRGSGHLITTSSVAGVTGYPTAAAYTMSKACVLELTRSLREEARDFGVRVSAACPGYVDTGIFTQERTVGAELGAVMRDLPARMMSPAAAAAAILAGTARGREMIVFPFTARMLWTAAVWAPWLIKPLHARLLKSFR